MSTPLDAVELTDAARAFVLTRYRHHLRNGETRIEAMLRVRDALAVTFARDAVDCWPMSMATLARFAAAEHYVTILQGSGLMAAFRPVWRGDPERNRYDSFPRAARLARRTSPNGKDHQ